MGSKPGISEKMVKLRMLKCLNAIIISSGLFFAAWSDAASSDKFGLGRLATQQEIKAWNIDIRPDGSGLPQGSGSVVKGEEIYLEQCASCHGEFGEAVGRWPALSGGEDTLKDDDPVKTVGSYWPYLSTVWDYVNRAMPFGNAQSLSVNDVYAVTAYILNLNDLVDDDFVLSRSNFKDIEMPNKGGFYNDDRKDTEIWSAREFCMSDCKKHVAITARARVLDVTPEQEARRSDREQRTDKSKAETSQEASLAGENVKLLLRGEKVFNKCKSCHAMGASAKHKIGPHLNGIFGKVAGQQTGFKKYSKSILSAGENGLIWDNKNLTEFLISPKKKVRGTKMIFSGLKKPEDIEAVIYYIRSADRE